MSQDNNLQQENQTDQNTDQAQASDPQVSQELKNIIEAVLMIADQPLSLDRMLGLFNEDAGDPPERNQLKLVLAALEEDYAERGIELKQVASGYRLQAKADVAKWVNRLWTERPPKYTRALLETLAIIAYRQPITRGEIEAIRGVSVSSNVVKTLLEREWIKVAGHRDVPGRPAVYATTRHFLDYFNLKSLSELPTLTELRDLDAIAGDLFNQPFQVISGNKDELSAQQDENEKDKQEELDTKNNTSDVNVEASENADVNDQEEDKSQD